MEPVDLQEARELDILEPVEAADLLECLEPQVVMEQVERPEVAE